jgi:hypothetical protein
MRVLHVCASTVIHVPNVVVVACTSKMRIDMIYIYIYIYIITVQASVGGAKHDSVGANNINSFILSSTCFHVRACVRACVRMQCAYMCMHVSVSCSAVFQ